MSTKWPRPRRQDAALGVEESTALVAIVDDDESLRKALIRLLRSEGYSVDGFASATELLSALSSRMPHCVILDLQLPGMTGTELLQHFAELADAPPVVVITGNDAQGVRERCLALGADRYFRKPLDSDALLDAVREIVNGTG